MMRPTKWASVMWSANGAPIPAVISQGYEMMEPAAWASALWLT